MGYISFKFVIFVLVLVLIYYISPKKYRGIILLIASLLFYLSFNLKYILFLMFTAISTYISALLLNKYSKKRIIFVLCILANVGVWSFIKVFPWGMHLLTHCFNYLGIPFNEPIFSIIVPIGISYYMLQAIGYLIDVYKNNIKAEKTFWKYLLYLSFFPTVIQGPISKYNKIMPELLNKKNFSFNEMRCGLVIILFGLVKKIVIADRLGIFVNYCFDKYTELSGVILIFGAIFYSFQLYFDFSGCVDICRGICKIFNIDLMHNFDRPYFATSIKDFWNRWHISLSLWLKEYIYIPLGGNRKGVIRKNINLIITFLISAIWHGAGFSFFFWGFLHGLYQIIANMFYRIKCKFKNLIRIKIDSTSDRIYKILVTFSLVTFAWIFFRAGSLLSALEYIQRIFINFNIWDLFNGNLFLLGIGQNYFNLIILHLLFIFILEYKYKTQESLLSHIFDLHIFIRWGIYFVLLFDIILFGTYGSGFDLTSFMYGGF